MDSTAAATVSRRARRERWRLTPKSLALIALALTSLSILVVMSGSDITVHRADTFPWFDVDFLAGPNLFAANTPTGGDMGAHVYIPAYLRDTLLPQGRIMGWSNDWYAGFPILYFYFPLPALTIVLFDVLLPYGVAFKLVTVAGLLALPFASYFLARSMRFPRPVATIAGVAGGTYIFMESHTIFGGNIAATLAGEYSFSWSLALSLVYLGLVIRDSREGRRFSPGAAAVLALTALSHLITTLVVVIVSLPILFRKRGATPVLSAWIGGFALTGFWTVPLLARVNSHTTDMGWNPVDNIFGNTSPFPREMLPVLVLGTIGLVWAALARYDVIAMFFMALVPLAMYFAIDVINYTKLYNARVLPYWYFTLYLFAGIGAGLLLLEVAKRVGGRERFLIGGTAALAGFFLVAGLAGLSFAPGWAKWNYEGYENKAAYSEYEALNARMSALPPGRVMWEANSDMNKYGTPMALMLLPYWTEGDNPSMEGLLFESSITTPFHFLLAAEVSERPSNPVRGLTYRNRDLDRALEHLALFDVQYYVAFTPEAKQRADVHLDRLFDSEPFTVYRAPDADLVEIATLVPAVYEGEDFFEAALSWYDDVDHLDQWFVTDGPDTWPRFDDTDAFYGATAEQSPLSNPQPIAVSGQVSDVVLEDHRIAFRTTAIGVPHLIKVSHFPNWSATGAEGPYRAAPSLMIVVPTEENVELNFGYTWAEQLGFLLSGVALLFFAGYAVVAWRRRSAAAGPALAPEPQAEASQAEERAGHPLQ